MSSRGSHKWCERCKKRWVDKRAAHGMCKVCKAEHVRELRQQRADVKRRRVARTATPQEVLPVSEAKNPAEPDLSPEVIAAEINVGTIAEPKRQRGGVHERVVLTDQQKLEIVNLYMTTDTSMPEIARAFGLQNSYPYYVLKMMGVTWRRGDGTPPPGLEDSKPHTNGVVKPEIVDQVPEDVVKALERMVKMPEVPARPEPVRAIVAQTAPSLPEYVEQVLPSPAGEETWRVDYEGSVLVRASSIEQAIELAKLDGHIRTINAVTRRTR